MGFSDASEIVSVRAHLTPSHDTEKSLEAVDKWEKFLPADSSSSLRWSFVLC